MKLVRIFSAAVAAVLTVMSAAAYAGEAVKFDTAAFAEAQKAGKSILVDVHATWCSTCKSQKASLDDLKTKPEYKDVIFYRIDFDSQKEAWTALGVQSQSTLIAFKGDKETGRSVGEKNKDAIDGLLKSTL